MWTAYQHFEGLLWVVSESSFRSAKVIRKLHMAGKVIRPMETQNCSKSRHTSADSPVRTRVIFCENAIDRTAWLLNDALVEPSTGIRRPSGIPRGTMSKGVLRLVLPRMERFRSPGESRRHSCRRLLILLLWTRSKTMRSNTSSYETEDSRCPQRLETQGRGAEPQSCHLE